MPRPLYRREFQPIATVGDVIGIYGSGVAAGLSWREITHVEAVPLIGQHGAVVIWTPAGAIPAGYAIDKNAANGAIAAAGAAPGSIQTGAIQQLQFQSNQIAQLRFRVKFIGAPGNHVSDVDVQVTMGAQRWAGNNFKGVANVGAQSPDAVDVTALPAQNADWAIPAAFPGLFPFDAAYRTELFVWEDNAPIFTILNNGSIAMTGANSAVALEIAAFVYNTVNVPTGHSSHDWTERTLLGERVKVPAVPWNELVLVPIAGTTPPVAHTRT